MRWGHLSWPGDLTLHDLTLTFFTGDVKLFDEKLYKVSKSWLHWFLSYNEKPDGGGVENNPPALRLLSFSILTGCLFLWYLKYQDIEGVSLISSYFSDIGLKNLRCFNFMLKNYVQGGWKQPSLISRKRRNVATSGKRRWIGWDKIYKKYQDHFWVRSKTRSAEVTKLKMLRFFSDLDIPPYFLLYLGN